MPLTAKLCHFDPGRLDVKAYSQIQPIHKSNGDENHEPT